MKNSKNTFMLIEVRFAERVEQWLGYNTDTMTPLMCTRYGVSPEYAEKWAVVAAYTSEDQKTVANFVQAFKHAEDHGISDADVLRQSLSNAGMSKMIQITESTESDRPGS